MPETEMQQTARNAPPIDTWAIVELLGHVRMAGRLTEESHFGVALGRLDVPDRGDGGGFTTVWFGGGSVYRVTPTTEEIARAVAAANQPEPVHRWELPALTDSQRADEALDEPVADCEACGVELNAEHEVGLCADCAALGGTNARGGHRQLGRAADEPVLRNDDEPF